MKSHLRFVTASLALLLIGCAGRSVEPPAPALPTAKPSSEPWFCEMNAAGNDWECVRDAALARHPAPRRLPQPRPPEAPPPGPPPASASPPPEPAAATATPPAPSLRDLPRDLYTVQLVAMKDRAELETFVRESGIPELSGARVENDGQIFYALLLGIFPDRAAAERAAAARPAALKSYDPWIRPLGSLQDAMARADQLAGTSQY